MGGRGYESWRKGGWERWSGDSRPTWEEAPSEGAAEQSPGTSFPAQRPGPPQGELRG